MWTVKCSWSESSDAQGSRCNPFKGKLADSAAVRCLGSQQLGRSAFLLAPGPFFSLSVLLSVSVCVGSGKREREGGSEVERGSKCGQYTALTSAPLGVIEA